MSTVSIKLFLCGGMLDKFQKHVSYVFVLEELFFMDLAKVIACFLNNIEGVLSLGEVLVIDAG